ncbi:glycosyltransferase family 2 protein [Rhizobium sp. YAF28]|uniref:glycosyltransferase family 2 protein n=1 Tax=Rhizobium sp. YAF28 TaxID=3233081 RepID=UPI003F9759A2
MGKSVDGADVKTKLSIVAPCYNEAEGLSEFCRRAKAAAEAVAGGSFEIILVDDGSSDNTWGVISGLAADIPQVLGVKLLRNHGHQLAATSGLAVARGERVLLIDADLQDPPELLAEMMAIMDQGADVVYGQRSERKGETKFKLITASVFYRLLTRLTSISIPQDTGDFRLMKARIVHILLNMPERHRFTRGMVSWIGGRQVAPRYTRDARYAGATKYPLRKMIRFAIDAITSFSIIPLRVSAWMGLISAVFAVGLLIYTLVQWFEGNVITGWSSIMAAVSALSAIQLIALGTLGEYVGRLVQEHKRRPMFMIDCVVQGEVTSELPDDFSELDTASRRSELGRLSTASVSAKPLEAAVGR